jgi:DNA replication factor GINS
VHLDELRTVLISERETGRLLSLPPDLYESTGEELESLLGEVYANEDPFSDKARVLIERVSSIRETLQDLFMLRAEKILGLARNQEEGHHIDRDELKRMLPEEREMFDGIVLAIGQSRCRLIPCTKTARAVHPAAPTCESCEAILEDAAVPPDFVLSRVLADMEPFMGVDGRIYQLKQEDIVTLPARNAEVLCGRNIVLDLKMPAIPPPRMGSE